jgi:hypothetical protein
MAALIERYKVISIKAAELQCPMRFKRLTKLTKADKQELWALLDDGTRTRLKELSRKYQGPLRSW